MRGCSCAAGRAAKTKPATQRAASAPAARLTFLETFIYLPPKECDSQSNKISDHARFHAELADAHVASDEEHGAEQHEHPGVTREPALPRQAEQQQAGHDDEERRHD